MSETSNMLTISDIQLLYKSPQKKYEYNFGTFNIKIKKGSPLWAALHFLIELDRSGSTGEGSEGKDNKTAWDNIVHTIQCSLNYCNESEIQTFVSIILFDHEIFDLCHSKEITDKSVVELSSLLGDRKKYYPRGSTNIYEAMKAARKAAVHDFDEWCVDKPYQTFNMLMTDGCPTAGPTDLKSIASVMPKDVENYLFGFGIKHNEKLLTNLVEKSPKGGEYHFTPTFEQAGVVYGTVFDSIYNRYAQKVTVTVENCEIYNFKTNTWGKTLELGSMAFESERMVHLRFPWDNVEERKVCVTYIPLDNEVEHILRKSSNEYSTKENPDEAVNKDVLKYLFRQEVLEILHHTKHKSLNEKTLHTNITSLGEVIKTFMKSNQLDDEPFLNQLCDDLMVALHSMEMTQDSAAKYCSDRQAAQGTQRAYNATIPNRCKRSDNMVTAPVIMALARTPLFRNHSAAAPRSSSYAAPRQVAAQRSCTGEHTSLNYAGDSSDDEDFYDASPSARPNAEPNSPICFSASSSPPAAPPRALTAHNIPLRPQRRPNNTVPSRFPYKKAALIKKLVDKANEMRK